MVDKLHGSFSSRPLHTGMDGLQGSSVLSDRDSIRSKVSLPSMPCYDTWQPWSPPPSCPHGDSIQLHESSKVVSRQAGLGDFFSWMWNWATGKTPEEPQQAAETLSTDPTSAPAPSTIDPTKRRPRLQSPEADEGTLENLIIKMNQNMRRIEELESDTRDFLKKNPYLSDMELLRLLFAGLEKQKQNRAESAQVSQEKLLKEQEVKKNLHKKLHELIIEKMESDAKVGKTSWFGSILSACILGLGAASVVVAAIFSGGAAIPLAFTLANAGALAAQGANKAVQGYYEDKSNKFQSNMYGTKEEKSVSHRRIQACLSDLKAAYQYVSQCVSLHSQALRSYTDAASSHKN